MARTLCGLAAFALLTLCLAACSPTAMPAGHSLCEGVDCGAGHCVIDSGDAACLCDPGHYADGLTCRSLEPCSPNPCTEAGRTRCNPNGGRAECLCDSDRTEVDGACVERTPCSPNPCTQAFQTVCEVEGTHYRCLCDPGHAPVGGGCDSAVTWDCSIVHTTGTPDAFEPDECPAKATAIVAAGSPVAGHTINPAGDADWFVLQASALRIYRFSATSSDRPVLYADAFAGDGLTPIAADHRGNPAVDMRFKAAAPGPLYVRVRGLSAGATGAYSFTVSDDEIDDFPDDAASALAIGLDAVVNGALQFDGDKDVMRLPMTATTSEQVSVDWNGAGDAVLEILAADGVSVKQRRVGPAPKVVTHSARNESLFIRVSAFIPATLGSFAVHTQSLGADDHGDTNEDATAVTAGAGVIGIASERDGDVDVLAIQTGASHLYRFSCTSASGGGGGGLSLMLVDDKATVLAQSQSSYQPTLSYRAPSSRRLYIQAQAVNYGSTTTRFDCQLTDAGFDDHGDDASTATPISVGGTGTTGRLEVSTDVDMFAFAATANHVYSFSCQSRTPSYSLVSVLLLNGSGAQVAEGENEVTAATPTSGTYYAEVRSFYYELTTPLDYTCTLQDLGADDYGDTIATATPITVGAAPTSGQLGTSTDRDVFSFAIAPPHMYRVACTATSSTRLSVRVLGPSGSLVAASGAYYTTTVKVGFKATSAGSYYTEVSSSWSYDSFPISYTCGVEDLGLDDYGDDVTNADPIALGATGSGALQYAGDLDVFKLTATAGRVYRFTCIGVPGDVCDVQITNASGLVLASTGTSVNTPIAFEPPAAGLIYITIGSTDSYGRTEGTYSFLLEDVGVDDHGDSILSATAVTLPSPAQTAAIDYQNDVDVFSITGVATHIYRMTCIAGTLQECSITAHDAMGNLVASASVDDFVAFQAAASGTYYFEVKSAFGSNVGTYTWQILDDGTDDYGNTSATATAITVGTAAAGAIQYSNDKDVFTFAMVARHIYRASCTAQASLYCGITVRDQLGSQLAYKSSQASWNAPSGGSAYVEVSGSFNDLGTYSLLVEDAGVDDHGDTYQTATALQGIGVAQSGTLEVSSDIDFFSISLAASTRYTVTVTGGSYLDVYVLGTNGTTNIAASSSPVSFTTTVAGTYYIRVSTWSSSSPAVSYTVTVN